MICFEIWWNSADADAFRAKHEEHDGAEFKPVWDAAVRAMLDAAPAAPAVAPAQDAFDVALTALDRYQHNWDTGLPGEYAQPERIHMECAVEAVREALTEARDAAPAQAEQQGDDGETPRPMTDAILRRMLKDETRGDTVYRCGYNQAIENVRKILAMRSHLETGEQPSARVALSDDEMFEAFNQGYDGISDKGDLGSYKRAVLAGIKAILAASAAQGGKS